MDVNAILAGVRSGAMEIKEAEKLLKKLQLEQI